MKIASIIPYGAGRLDNLLHVLETLKQQTQPPAVIFIVCDGPEADAEVHIETSEVRTVVVRVSEKFLPENDNGIIQPRNAGVFALEAMMEDFPEDIEGVTHVHFCDTDVILDPVAYEAFDDAMKLDPTERILIGPYEWMGPGVREPQPQLFNDPRWVSFNAHGASEVIRGDLSAGLACFSGNLVWPLSLWEKAGGFWNDIHHGRCEDGELGIRAVALGIPISFVSRARGWHLDHPRNHNWIIATNGRDVPMLNERHPWMEGEGVFMVEEDGRRFNCRCPVCAAEMNTAEIWSHQASHRAASVVLESSDGS